MKPSVPVKPNEPSIWVWFLGHQFVRDPKIDDLRCARCEQVAPRPLNHATTTPCSVQVH